MSEAPIAELLTQAMQLVRERRKQEARTLLMQIIERDEQNEQAWLWLSGVVDDPRDMQVALANCLTLNPRNEQAHKGMDVLRARYGNLLGPEEEPPAAIPPARVTTVDNGGEENVYTFACYSCKTEVNSVADSCWACHAVIHCCENCFRGRETECKEREGIRGPAASVVRNKCQEWRPA